MSKAILLSIKPKYVADILNGKKTIEIRKTMPKCDLPIDVYIYCKKYILNGKVVAKFTLRKVEKIKFHFGYYDMGEWTESYILENACLTSNELDNYLKASKDYDEKKIAKVCGYAWHIEDLVIFDKSKELSSFVYYNVVKNNLYAYGEFPLKTHLTKAPQSYCYVESEE